MSASALAADVSAGDRARGVVCIDGELMPCASARVSPFDHGYLYGDGLFETLRVYDGQLFRLDAHLARLEQGIEALQIAGAPPMSTLREWTTNAVLETGLTDASCRITVTRGIGDAGLDPLGCERATVVIAALPLRLPPPAVYEQGLEATVLWARSHHDLPPLTVKSTSYQRAALAWLEVRRRGSGAGLFLDRHGHVAEAITANVFAVVQGRLLTPPLHECLAGVTRAEVLSVAAELGLESDVTALPVDVVTVADEVFLTSSIAELVPISSIDGRVIGSGSRGPTTARIHESFTARTRADDAPGRSLAERKS